MIEIDDLNLHKGWERRDGATCNVTPRDRSHHRRDRADDAALPNLFDLPPSPDHPLLCWCK